MAEVVDKDILHCSCCGLTAVKLEWSCGCVTVAYDEDASSCGDCDNFSHLRYNGCGKPGWPGS
jgi:hypothetical protein